MPTHRRRAPEYTVEAARFEQLSARSLTEPGMAASSSRQMALCIDFCLIGWDTKRCLPGSEPGCTSSAVALRLFGALARKNCAGPSDLSLAARGFRHLDRGHAYGTAGVPCPRAISSFYVPSRAARTCVRRTTAAATDQPRDPYRAYPTMASAAHRCACKSVLAGVEIAVPLCSLRDWGGRSTAASISFVYFRLC